MIIHESWKYYELDIFKLTDNMSDIFIMWSVTLSRDGHVTRGHPYCRRRDGRFSPREIRKMV